jgi:hypothetical protein
VEHTPWIAPRWIPNGCRRLPEKPRESDALGRAPRPRTLATSGSLFRVAAFLSNRPEPTRFGCRLGPVAMTRLASLHRAASSRVASTRDGSLEVSSHVGLGPGSSRARALAAYEPSCARGAGDGCVEPAGPEDRFSRRPAWDPFQSLAPRSDGYRLPGPCPLVVGTAALQITVRAPASGLRSPIEVLEVLEDPRIAFLGFLSGVFPSAARAARFVLPGPSSSVLRVLPPVGGRHPAPWSLANGGVGWSRCDCRPL